MGFDLQSLIYGLYGIAYETINLFVGKFEKKCAIVIDLKVTIIYGVSLSTRHSMI